MDAYLTLGVAIVLLLVFVLPYYLSHRKREKKTASVYQKMLEQGSEEPDTLHPIIDPNACMCTGNCVTACPENDVLGILQGTALAINPMKCVGHGLCERVCPVEAIRLVVGTSTRGVDIPRIQENYETNVAGMFVVGELGGMGLIRNAFEQARQCIEGIARSNSRAREDVLDVLIVGCGPAGLAASLHCKHHDLKFLTIEKEDIGGAVRYYPRKKLVMTFPLEVPGYGKLNFKQIVKEDLIALWEDIITKAGIGPFLKTREAMLGIERGRDHTFDVKTDKGAYRARHIVLAIGRRGVPRKLDIPGEHSSHVAYSLIEPEHYQGNKVVVVGGGDSAVEAALALADQPGNKVRLSYRKDSFSRIKAGNRAKIEAAIESGAVDFLPNTNLTKIYPDAVEYRNGTDMVHRIPNEYVFVMIGGTLPTGMLKELGIAIDTKFGEPLAVKG